MKFIHLGHESPMLKALFFKEYPCLISCDITGILKVFKLKKWFK